jgi:hypothetical protein
MPYRSVATFVFVILLAGCAASPRQRPVSVGDVSTGTGSLAEARKRLEGSWQLVSLRMINAEGRQADVEASGSLRLDGFGNLHIEFKMSPAGQQAMASIGITSPNPVLSTSGQAVIDPAQQRVSYVGDDFMKSGGMDAGLAAKRANPLAVERVRYYRFEDDGTLVLTTRYPDGKDASIGRWKKG